MILLQIMILWKESTFSLRKTSFSVLKYLFKKTHLSKREMCPYFYFSDGVIELKHKYVLVELYSRHTFTHLTAILQVSTFILFSPLLVDF